MPKTLTDMTQGVFLRLNEALNSSVGSLEAGAGNTAVQATTATIQQWLDLGMAEMFRTCLLLSGKATATLATGQQVVAFQDMPSTMDRSSVPDGSVLWAAADVSYNGTALTYCGREAARLRFNSYYATANSTPFWWWREGNYAVSVYPPPAFTATLVVRGYCLPPSLATSATAVYMQDDLTQYVEMYAAVKIAEKSYDDPSVFGRISHIAADFNEGRKNLFRKIPSSLASDLSMTEPPALATPPKR